GIKKEVNYGIEQVDANGEVVFTEQDGIKKEVNYGIETDGVRNGYTVRYDLGGEKEKDITVNLPGGSNEKYKF
ncbi:hypothetical protein S9U_00566, partial [Enterococcus faecalis EnGen0095]